MKQTRKPLSKPIRAALWLWAVATLTAGGLIVTLELTGWAGDFPRYLLSRAEGSVRLVDRSGRTVRETLSVRGQRLRWIPLRQMSPHLIQAVAAAEDARYLSHRGVDYRAIMRAAWMNLTGRRAGGSTISQQVVKLLVRPPERSLSEKWREAVLALRLERALSKEQILEQYLNRAPFGPQVIGAEAASRWLFRRSAADLSLAQAALLAALVKGPSYYHPRRHRHRARKRRDWVLGRMRALGWIRPEQHRWATSEPLAVVAGPPPFRAPHFAARVLRDAAGEERTLETTLDLGLQRHVETTVRRVVARLRGRGGSQAAAIVVDNHTGDVMAYVGSQRWSDPTEGRNDGVVALRQPGSTLKPFAYALSFEQGHSGATQLLDLPVTFDTAMGEYSPRNYDGTFHGPVLGREALANSYNVPAVRVAADVTPGALLQRLRQAGFRSLKLPDEHYGLGLVLGNGEVSLFELARAYVMLARGGELIEPRFLRTAPFQPARRVFSREVAYQVTHILSDVHARKAAFGERSALELPFPAAAKTGTSTDFRDNWTVGYTPEVTVAVWVGSFSGRPMQGVSGVAGAAPLFNDVMRAAMAGRPRRGFARPPGLVRALVCPRSGMLAGPHCFARREELFRVGFEPRHSCSLHVEVRIDRRNGLLAGEGCPERVVEIRRAERYPPSLSRWAVRAKRPLAPRRYSPLCPGPRVGIRAVAIEAPRNGALLTLSPDLPRSAQRLALLAVVDGAPEEVRWLLDGREIARSRFPYQASWQIEPGEHSLVVAADGVRSPPVTVRVVGADGRLALKSAAAPTAAVGE